jgi:hypothetical protein
MPMKERKAFEEDKGPLTTAKQKNDALIKLLQGSWNKEDLVLIERIEIAAQGWRITYREVD